jgi:hypothetical protein
MPTKEQGVAANPEAVAAVRSALHRLLLFVTDNGFTAPLDLTVCDQDGGTLRQFSIRKDGIQVGASDALGGLFVLPLTIYLTDAKARAARLRVPASLAAEPIEFTLASD